jgi:hypothetical protein
VRGRSQSSGVAPDCPMQLKDKGSNDQVALNPNERADVAHIGQWTLAVLGVCFVAEDPKAREHLRQTLSEAAPKLPPRKLRHSNRSQDEGVNRLKDEMT